MISADMTITIGIAGKMRFSAIARSVMISAAQGIVSSSTNAGFSAIARSVMISA